MITADLFGLAYVIVIFLLLYKLSISFQGMFLTLSAILLVTQTEANIICRDIHLGLEPL